VTKEAPNDPSDKELVEQMAAGRVDALRVLTQRFGNVIFALAKRVLSDAGDAEEVSADVFWQAWREASSFNPSRGSPVSWLITIARSRAIDRLRARQTFRRSRPEASDFPLSSDAMAADPHGDAFDRFQRYQTVRAAVARLDNGDRAVLELSYFSELSHSEISDRLKLPLGTVKTRIRSAMVRLRLLLSESLEGRRL